MIPRLLWLSLGCVVLLGAMTGRGIAGGDFSVTAPAFAPGQPIPAKYALAGGSNRAPELKVEGAPDKTRSLVLIVDDPDAPSGLWTHWLVWNLPADLHAIAENELPEGAGVGKNSFGDVRYDGPSPPSGTHRYFFHLYALDMTISLPSGSGRNALEAAMAGHVVASAETYGTYSAP